MDYIALSNGRCALSNGWFEKKIKTTDGTLHNHLKAEGPQFVLDFTVEIRDPVCVVCGSHCLIIENF